VLLYQPEELAGRGGDAARRLEQARLDALDGRLQEQVDQLAEGAGSAALGGGDGVDVGDAGGDEQDQGLLEVGHGGGAARGGGVAQPGGGPRLGLRLGALQGQGRPGHAGGGGLHVQAEDIVRAAEGGGGLRPVLALGVGGHVIHGGVGLQQLALVDGVALAEAVGRADGHALHEQVCGDADGDRPEPAPRGPEHQVARPGPPSPQFVPGLPAGAAVGVAARGVQAPLAAADGHDQDDQDQEPERTGQFQGERRAHGRAAPALEDQVAPGRAVAHPDGPGDAVDRRGEPVEAVVRPRLHGA